MLPEGYREVAVPLKHGEAGATPVDAPNEEVTQMDRVLVSETSGHRYRFAEASYDPCHPRSWKLASLAPKPTNGRLQDWGTLREGKAYNSQRLDQISRSPSGLAKPAEGLGVGLQNRLFVGNAFGNASRTIPSLESNHCSVA